MPPIVCNSLVEATNFNKTLLSLSIGGNHFMDVVSLSNLKLNMECRKKPVNIKPVKTQIFVKPVIVSTKRVS